MNTLMKILCLNIVLMKSFVLMKSEDVYVRTEGETVDIRCTYSDDHTYTSKYFCRHPCKSVLIKSAKSDQVNSNGRYSLTDIMSGRFFTVSIKHLRLTDSGVYYCGLDQWFSDTKNKVTLSVHPVLFSAAPVSRSTHTPENTHLTSTWTPTLTSADNSHSYELTTQSPGSPPVNSSSVSVTVICAGVLLFLFFWILVASVCIYSRRSDAKSRSLKPHPTEDTAQGPPDINQAVDDVCTMVVYSSDDPPKEDCSSLNYPTIVHYST